MNKYNPTQIEKKWQKIWERNNTSFSKVDEGKKKFYVFLYRQNKLKCVQIKNGAYNSFYLRFKL